MPDWNSIATAPRDGSRLRLKRIFQRAVIADGEGFFGNVTINYEDGPQEFRDVWVHGDGSRLFPTPTHWKPALLTKARRAPVD